MIASIPMKANDVIFLIEEIYDHLRSWTPATAVSASLALKEMGKEERGKWKKRAPSLLLAARIRAT